MSIEKKHFATVCIRPNTKHCFIELSSSLAKQCCLTVSDKMPAMICIEGPNGQLAYASWTSYETYNGDDQTLYIGKCFADCLGFKEQDLVYVSSFFQAAPCEKVFVAPVKQEEWQLLELNAQFIEQKMLDQIRTVYCGLEFAIFLKGSAVVNVKVESMSPDARIGFLEEFSELHLIPKPKNDSMIQRPIEAGIRNKLKNTSLYSRKMKKQISKETNVSSFWSYLYGLFNDDEHEVNKKDNVIEKRELRKAKAMTTCEEKVTHINEVIRIHPVAIEKGSQRCFTDCSFNDSPFNLFVSRKYYDTIVGNCSCGNGYKKNKIIVKIKSIESPRQKDESKRKKNAKEGNTTPEAAKSAVVNLLPLNDEEYDSIMLTNTAAMDDKLLAHLNVEQGSQMTVCCLHEDALEIKGIVVNVLHAERRELTTEDIMAMFLSWVKRNFDVENHEILLCNAIVLEINLPTESNVTVALEILSNNGMDMVEDRHYFINKNTLETASIVVKFCSEDDKGLTRFPAYERLSHKRDHIEEDLGGVSDLNNKGITYLKGILNKNRLDSNMAKANFVHKGSMLISGSSRATANGCGRTALGNLLCSHFQKSPYHSHIEKIDCISLRGKKPETILRRLKVAMQEAKWRQPSIVMFDDIDYLIRQPDEIKDAEPTIQYHSRLAEGLKDLLRQEIISTDLVATILIAKTKSSLHEIFSMPSGWHFITCSLVLRPPNEHCRMEIIESLTRRVSCSFAISTDLKRIATMTEGYLPTDLEIIVKRAKHASIRKSHAHCRLSLSDFEESIKGYKPVGLHGIELHSPGNLGWQHVGGLTDAKRVLMETFVWPMKFQNLFSKCPFPMRSGVLLYGPSGTGKTLLAGIVAKESGMNFVSIKGPELLSKYVGSSEQNVRDLFARAQSASPCILFFDEFDALAPKRGHDNTGVTDRVVNQLLTQLDGVEKLDKVFILAASSRPDLIDPALLRPGRLDRCVFCPMPCERDRLEILNALREDVLLEKDVDLNSLSQRTENFSGADLKALLYNAQLKSIHKRHPMITREALQSSEKIKIQEEDFQMKITQDDIIEALEETRPSVSQTEVKLYNARFQNFSESRKGNYKADEVDVRVTLA